MNVAGWTVPCLGMEEYYTRARIDAYKNAGCNLESQLYRRRRQAEVCGYNLKWDGLELLAQSNERAVRYKDMIWNYWGEHE